MAMIKVPDDSWHFARPVLAKKYIDTFEVGLISAQALFAPRRMGKSEFLEKDLIPAARSAGYVCAYLNLWDSREQPRLALVRALTAARSSRGSARLLKRLKHPLRKIKATAKLGLAEGSLEADLSDEKASDLALTEIIRSFDKPARKLLLVLDEAQVLASAINTDLTHALRAGLDTRKQTIKVIFAGSSENSLRQMFARATEPFYNWAPIEPFERLGAQFVAAMTRKVNTLCRFRLSERDALRAFDTLKRTPEFFRRFLGRYLQYADQGAEAALQDTVAHVFSDSGFRTIWGRLNPTDRAVLRAMAQGEQDLHSVAVRTRLGEELGLGKRVPAGTPRNSLTRLQKAELVTRVAHGDYQIQDEGLIEWIRQLDLEE
jgi:hypothetical protein